jgi:hypothetical protein
MTRLHVFLFLVVIGAPAAGFGQWLHYPTADVPRKADDSPDLTAGRLKILAALLPPVKTRESPRMHEPAKPRSANCPRGFRIRI